MLAPRNEHKVHELNQILGSVVTELDLQIVPVTAFPEVEDVPETEVSFVGNATLKAVAVAAATGLPALADDSGLTVEVLGGAPGVFSARWSGSRAGAGAPRAHKDLADSSVSYADLDRDTRTLAEFTDVEKNAISHRGRAFRALAPVLLERLRDL